MTGICTSMKIPSNRRFLAISTAFLPSSHMVTSCPIDSSWRRSTIRFTMTSSTTSSRNLGNFGGVASAVPGDALVTVEATDVSDLSVSACTRTHALTPAAGEACSGARDIVWHCAATADWSPVAIPPTNSIPSSSTTMLSLATPPPKSSLFTPTKRDLLTSTRPTAPWFVPQSPPSSDIEARGEFFWQTEPESGSDAILRIEPDCTAHQMHKALAQKEPESCPSVSRAVGGLNLHIRLEYARVPFFRNAASCVRHLKPNGATAVQHVAVERLRRVVDSNAHADGSNIRELYRIGYEIEKQLLHSVSVGNNFQIIDAVDSQLKVRFLFEFRSDNAYGIVDHAANIE
eukprot:Opistho-2@94743